MANTEDTHAGRMTLEAAQNDALLVTNPGHQTYSIRQLRDRIMAVAADERFSQEKRLEASNILQRVDSGEMTDTDVLTAASEVADGLRERDPRLYDLVIDRVLLEGELAREFKDEERAQLLLDSFWTEKRLVGESIQKALEGSPNKNITDALDQIVTAATVKRMFSRDTYSNMPVLVQGLLYAYNEATLRISSHEREKGPIPERK